MPDSPHQAPAARQPRLGLWDAVSIIIGIVIGASIFKSPPLVFQNVPSPAWGLSLWAVGGFVSWCGAVCYGELATSYPHDGGDYVYLSRAFGGLCGFLFAWAQLTVIISGNIGVMAYVFVDYALKIWPAWQPHQVWLAVAPILVLTAINLVGVVAGKTAQNFLSVLKVAGLLAIVAAAVWAGAKPNAIPGAPAQNAPAASNVGPVNIGLALVFVLYAFGGWIHAPYVASEVRDQHRNMPRALVLAIAVITAVYLAVNASYLSVLGFAGLQTSQAPAADLMRHAAGGSGETAVSVLVMLSALAAVNGMILTGARVYAAWGRDYPALGWLSHVGRGGGATPAILIQSAIAIAWILLVGTATGRNAFDHTLTAVGLPSLPWQRFRGGFDTLVAGTAAVYWSFCLLGGISVFVLRRKDPTRPRPYSIPFYPLPPLVLCASCAYLIHASAVYAGWLSIVGVVALFVGFAVSLRVRRILSALRPQ